MKEGYEPLEVDVIHKMSDGGAAGFAGNILLGGPVGAVVDAGSGATQDLFPNPIKVVLVPVGATISGSPAERSE